MPYDKLGSGKYRSKESGTVRTLGQIKAMHAKKPKKMAQGGVCRGMGAATRGGCFTKDG